MLLSIVLTLSPTAPAVLPPNLGQALHAWFLDRVRAADPAMSEALHTPNAERPFTVSNLLGLPRAHPGTVSLTPAQQVSVRLTSYWPELSAVLDEKVLPMLPDTTLNLLGCDLRICGWTDDAARHPWAGRTAYADLVRRCTLDVPPPRTITLDFASPTVFRSSGVNVPLPLPGLVFEGLARRWNLYAPLTVPPEVRRFGDEARLISRYRLWTERVAFGGSAGDDGAYPGFLGQCAMVSVRTTATGQA